MAAVTELFAGRVETIAEKSSVEIHYVVTEAASESDVRSAVLSGTPLYCYGLPRKSVELSERVNQTTWKVAVRYETSDSEAPPDTPEPVTSFDSTGGTQHITQSIATVGRYGEKASDQLGGAIGYDGENVNGVDITVPVWNWSETHYLHFINSPAYYSLTGKVNADGFRGFQPGEVLFLGASGTRRGDGLWEITFKFAASPNRADLAVGEITAIAKKGWEYLWVLYGDDVDENVKTRIKKPIAVYVEKVYEEGNLGSLGDLTRTAGILPANAGRGPSPMPKVVSGQKLRIYASDYNAMLDAAQALRNQQHNISVPLYGSGGAGIIPMRNDSGEDLPAFGVLDITGVVVEPADNEQEFLYRFTATGEKPSNQDNPSLAIAQEPIAAGKIGRVMVYGVSPVKLIRKDDDESPTAGASDSTAHLESAKLGAQVLWEEDYTGDEEHWALVRFPIVIGKKKSLDVVTDVTCNESTGQMDLETESIEYLSLDWKEEESGGTPTP